MSAAMRTAAAVTKGDDVDLELTGKTALVTGGSKGIGKAIARMLARKRACASPSARATARRSTRRPRRSATARSGEVIAIAGDLSRCRGVQRVVEARKAARPLDILVNNAGAIRGGDFLKIPDEQWAGDWSLKLLGYIRMARAVFPQMQAQGGGRICNVVGAAARNPTPTYLPGGVANAALINFTKGLADLGAPSRILVTAVSPAATARSDGTADGAAGRRRGQDRGGGPRGCARRLPARADRHTGGHRRSSCASWYRRARRSSPGSASRWTVERRAASISEWSAARNNARLYSVAIWP